MTDVRLGGWTRLWIVIGIIYLIPVSLITIGSLPAKLTPITQEDIKSNPWNANMSQQEIEQEIATRNQRIEKEAPLIHRERIKIITAGFLWWITPLLILYAFGSLIGWVYKGFKSQ